MSTTQDYQAAELLLRRPARPGELAVGDKIERGDILMHAAHVRQ